tara:strand:- start:332 stop:1060 length:729 start_codon:yes stop_codon:yes gene_type:complete
MIIANWKMNGSKDEVASWIKFVTKEVNFVNEKPCVFCPPSCYLDYSCLLIKETSSPILLGSQNISHKTGSALTGGIDSKMLCEFLTKYVLIGHSEQRETFSETNEVLRSKLSATLEGDISPILCIGEPLEVKQKGNTEKYLSNQLEVLEGLDLNGLIIAYEPIWAIGSGENATKEYIEKIHAFVKEFCSSNLNNYVKISVVYGGSVNSSNCEEIMSSSEVDGLLVGGASLDPDIFSKIYNLT